MNLADEDNPNEIFNVDLEHDRPHVKLYNEVPMDIQDEEAHNIVLDQRPSTRPNNFKMKILSLWSKVHQ